MITLKYYNKIISESLLKKYLHIGYKIRVEAEKKVTKMS